MRIRPATGEDLVAILATQLKNPQAAQWQASDYARLTEDPGGTLLVAEDEAGQILGFAAALRVADEAEVQNLAVNPEQRRRGIARELLRGVHRRLRDRGTKRVYLEVRPSNQPAVAFYHSVGYALVGERRDYYQAPPEDALVLSVSLVPGDRDERQKGGETGEC